MTASLPEAANPLAHPEPEAHKESRPIFWIGIAFSTFQLVTSAFNPLPSLVVRSVHVGFLLLMIFAFQAQRRRGKALAALDWALGLSAFVLSFYHWVFRTDLILRAGEPNLPDMLFGAAIAILVFEGARRMMGWVLPAICAAFIAYALWGNYAPGPLVIRGFGLDQVISQLSLGTEGIFGIPAYVSSTYIFLFILFGSFLEQAGMIGLFTDLAMGTVGHTKGGPAKVAVLSSAMMGTINGSGVANVVTVGQFTIPLMKRFGYSGEFAGAVEATASMGGQIMPPVMGAVAFIMAETLNVSYFEVVKAAIIPAILYFGTALWMVHLEAGRRGLIGLPKDQCPDAMAALRARWPLLLPLAALVVLLFSGYTPLFAGIVGLALTAMVILGLPISAAFKTSAAKFWRYVFWIGLGVGAASFYRFGIMPVLGVIAGLAAVNWGVRGGRETLRLVARSLVEGAKSALPVGIACALVGTIIGMMTLTGLAGTFTEAIVSVGSDSLFLSLVLTMLTCLVLGMGIPTIPNYIITSSLVGPILFKLGVPLLVSHMFVFYFGIMADLTPPVALAAFAAAPIARASGTRIGLQAVRIAAAGFVVPFMAVYDPALMLQTSHPLAVVYVLAKALISVGLWGAAAIGYLFRPLAWWERLLATAAAFMLVAALPMTDQAGFALAAVFIVIQWRTKGRVAT